MANENQDKSKKAKLATCKKREQQDKRKRLQNRAFRSQVRTVIKQLRQCIASNNQEEQKALLGTVYSLVDKAVNRSIFKRNKANRIKARLTAYMHAKTAK